MRCTTRLRSGSASPPKGGFCGTLWDICLRLLLMSLCRRWWTSCRTLSISSPHSRLILSRLSKCPRSCSSMSLCARPCALRSWWNSWWKYRRPCLTLRYSGLWNSSSKFQFLVVAGEFLVFTVLFPDRVQQRCLPWNAFLSGLWSRTSNSLLVEAFKIFSPGQSSSATSSSPAGVRGSARWSCGRGFSHFSPN